MIRPSRFSAPASSLVLLLALLAGPAIAATVDLLRVRQGVTPERTRVVLDISGNRFGWHETAEPSALLLRLEGVRLPRGFDPVVKGEGALKELRVEEETRDEVLLRLQFRSAATARCFRLPAGDGVTDRLVIDIRSAEGSGHAPQPPADPTPRPRRSGPRIVVIDPGHGGNDPGAVAPGLQEKEICIDVAVRLQKILDASPEAVAVLTRDKDIRIPLRDRFDFAEQADGDLFVSIHVNAAASRQARGAEVFFLSMGAATDEASRELARSENEADPDYVIAEDAELQNLPFLTDLRQSDTLVRSSRVAEVVLDVFQERKLAQVRGVKQAGFAVLKSIQVPSILVELGFISSEKDRADLKSPEHRQKLAEALAEGILRYFRQYAPRRAGESGS